MPKRKLLLMVAAIAALITLGFLLYGLLTTGSWSPFLVGALLFDGIAIVAIAALVSIFLRPPPIIIITPYGFDFTPWAAEMQVVAPWDPGANSPANAGARVEVLDHHQVAFSKVTRAKALVRDPGGKWNTVDVDRVEMEFTGSAAQSSTAVSMALNPSTQSFDWVIQRTKNGIVEGRVNLKPTSALTYNAWRADLCGPTQKLVVYARGSSTPEAGDVAWVHIEHS